jgi:hypothetical protein
MPPRLAAILAAVADRREAERAARRGAGVAEDDAERLEATQEDNNICGLRTEINAELARVAECSASPAKDPSPLTALRALRQRLNNAAALVRLHRHEQETLRLADLALRVEIGALSGLLRELLSATMRAEGRLQQPVASSAVTPAMEQSEHALLLAIQRALDDAAEQPGEDT